MIRRDLNTLLGIVFISALLVVAVNFVVDLLYARLDPRITSGSEHGRCPTLLPKPAGGDRPGPAGHRCCHGAVSAGWLFPRDPLSLAGRPLIWPGANPRFWLGTDNSGRDIAAQIFYGARISLLIGLVATLRAVAIGVVIGAVAGFYGGRIDAVLMRITEAFRDAAELHSSAGAGPRCSDRISPP